MCAKEGDDAMRSVSLRRLRSRDNFWAPPVLRHDAALRSHAFVASVSSLSAGIAGEQCSLVVEGAAAKEGKE